MIARPATSALQCGRCRNAILKAVVSRPAPGLLPLPAPVPRAVTQLPSPPPRTPSRGFISTALRSEAVSDVQATIDLEREVDEQRDKDDDDYEGTPWFLEVEPPRHPPIQHVADLPTVPEDAPPLLQPMVKYIYEDMGLDDLSLLDLRDLDPPAALGPNLMMLFGTARSERHLHVCSHRFVRWLKRHHKVNAKADGLIGPGELRTKLRRLRKKAKLLGTNASILPGGDNGISTGWVCVNFATSEGNLDESAKFDEGGRFSGFGAPQTGTTIIVQVMTESRRHELDLETLWQSLLRRNMEEMQKIQGRKDVSAAEMDALLSSKIQLPKSSSTHQWEALRRASQQHRYFSTSARRLQAEDGPIASPSTADSANGTTTTTTTTTTETTASSGLPDLTVLRQQISELQVAGTSVSEDILKNLISAVLLNPLLAEEEETAAERLVLVNQLCQLADERGMAVLSTDWLVTLIESIVVSPAYGPELQKAQRNLELVMAKNQALPLDPDQVLRLMAAHAQRHDWQRFWEVFRNPPRFRQPRGPELYELAYRVMAATRDRGLCVGALRWVYPEMLREDPQIWPVGSLYVSLKACILVADPAAENLLRSPPLTERMGTLARYRFKNREFLRVLREVERLRAQHAAAAAREQRAQSVLRLSEQRPPHATSDGAGVE